MRVFKFGGASVKDAESVRNVADILSRFQQGPLVVVLSAMDKMTNAFEQLAEYSFHGQQTLFKKQFTLIQAFHLNVLKDLFPDQKHSAWKRIRLLFDEIETFAGHTGKNSFDHWYDSLVPFGELLSTSIVSSYLEASGLKHRLIDARKIIRTNNVYRDARVLWLETTSKIQHVIGNAILPDKGKKSFVLTQGFIGSDPQGNTTTLGREGSDFTASIFAYALDAKEVVIWKDVPGLLNADPAIFRETVKIDRISYSDAIELAYYGAKIIHPKTIKPLQNKNISLFIKSFSNPDLPGTLINDSDIKYELVPSYIFKFNQTLISITPRDFSFINEENLFDVFGLFSQFHVHINLMQNSAISFSVCIDGDNAGFQSLILALQQQYKVKYNQNLDLITIRNYDQAAIEKAVNQRLILLEQRSRSTVQLLVVSA
jgi:aspartate kinase